MKQCPGEFGKKRDYSGLERKLWKPRTNADHHQQALKLKRCKTISKSLLLGEKSGITHYSILLELDYFDVIRIFTIDPIRNLFLGTAKMFSFWTENKIIDNKELQEIEQRIESMDVLSDIGRLPKRVMQVIIRPRNAKIAQSFTPCTVSRAFFQMIISPVGKVLFWGADMFVVRH